MVVNGRSLTQCRSDCVVLLVSLALKQNLIAVFWIDSHFHLPVPPFYTHVFDF